MRRALTVLVAVIATVTLSVAGAGAQDTGTVYIVHGLPGIEVDVYVDGEISLEGAEFTSISEAIALDVGDHRIEIYPAGSDPDDTDPVLSGGATLAAGDDVSVVAHLDSDGNSQLTVFPNDTSAVDDEAARVVLRHTAAAPAIDMRAATSPAITDLANGEQAVVDPVPATTLPIDIVPTGTDEVIYGPADLDLESGMVYVAYAVGSVDDETFEVLLQRLDPTAVAVADPAEDATTTSADTPAPTTAAAPTGGAGGSTDGDGDGGAAVPVAVPAGSGGLADTVDDMPLWAVLVVVGALLGIVGSGVVLARVRD